MGTLEEAPELNKGIPFTSWFIMRYFILLFLGLFLGSFASVFFPEVGRATTSELYNRFPDLEALAIIAVFFCVPCVLAVKVFDVVILYRGWKLVQCLRGTNDAPWLLLTPGRSVIYLFVPIVNVVWVYLAYPSVSE